jgi:TonB family protein
MKNNNMFRVMIVLSTALHGLAATGAARINFYAPPAVVEHQSVSAQRIIQVSTAPRRNAPGKEQAMKAVEKPVEAPPEIIPPQATNHKEEVQKGEEAQVIGSDAGNDAGSLTGWGNTENTEDVQGGAGWNGYGDVIADRNYEALLAYIKEFIDKNLAYPPMARRRNIQGVVGVHFEIETNGGLAAVMVDHSSGSSILDNAAVSLVKKINPIKDITIKRKLALNVNIDYRLTE